MNKQRYLLVVSGPSGAGKDTVVSRMMQKHPEIEISVSATTRAPRAGETDGENYYFLTNEQFEEKIDRMYTLREHFIEEVTKIPGVHVNGHTDRSNAPHIVSVSTEGVRAEVLLHALEDKEIYVSAGSACSSNKPSVSHTLKSIGLKPEFLDATIRFSFCVETTEEEIDYAVKEMAALVPMLQKYTRH